MSESARDGQTGRAKTGSLSHPSAGGSAAPQRSTRCCWERVRAIERHQDEAGSPASRTRHDRGWCSVPSRLDYARERQDHARPGFLFAADGTALARTHVVDFEWFPGMAVSPAQKSIDALHAAVGGCLFPEALNLEQVDGCTGHPARWLNLKIRTVRHQREFTLECAYQARCSSASAPLPICCARRPGKPRGSR